MSIHAAEGQIEARDPRTGRGDYAWTPTDPAALADVVTQARAAQPGWAALGLEGRIAVLERWRDAIAAAQPALIAAVSADTGRLAESLREAGNMGRWIDRWAAAARLALAETEGPADHLIPGFRHAGQFEPLGVVGIISPWNFPMSLSVMDAIPALLAGCAVIIKPSEVTPRFVEPLAATFADIPELSGVLTYVRGAGDLGAALVDQADGIVFTGSTATGRKVAQQAAARLVPCFVELGGKDAAVVLEGADLEAAARAIVTGATLGAGQQCYSTERIYVEAGIHDAFLELLVAKAQALRLAWPEPGDGQIGPLIHAPQAEIIARHLDDARSRGATIHCGGEIETHGGGLWVRPTVLSGVDHSMTVMREETFGPLLPVMAFTTEDELAGLMNDTDYGLSGAVFGPEDRALRVAGQMRAGGICINDAGATPFFIGDPGVCGSDAFGCSGLGGTRHGPDSILRFVRRKLLLINRAKGRSAWWYDV